MTSHPFCRGAIRDLKEWAFRGTVAGVLALTGYGSYTVTSQIMADTSSSGDSSMSSGPASPTSLDGTGGESGGGIPAHLEGWT